jgi:hypothetical protein
MSVEAVGTYTNRSVLCNYHQFHRVVPRIVFTAVVKGLMTFRLEVLQFLQKRCTFISSFYFYLISLFFPTEHIITRWSDNRRVRIGNRIY